MKKQKKKKKKVNRGVVTYYAQVGISKSSRRDAKLQCSRFFSQFCRDPSKHNVIFLTNSIKTILFLLETELNDSSICTYCVTSIQHISKNSKYAEELVNYYEVFPLLSKFVNHFDTELQERCIRAIGFLGSHKSTVQRLVAEGLLLPLIQLLDRSKNFKIRVAVLDCLSMLYLSHKICIRMMTIWFFPSFRTVSISIFKNLSSINSSSQSKLRRFERNDLSVMRQFAKLLFSFCRSEGLAETLLQEGGMINFMNLSIFESFSGKHSLLRRKIRKLMCDTIFVLTTFKNETILNYFLKPMIPLSILERIAIDEKMKKKKKSKICNTTIPNPGVSKRAKSVPLSSKNLFAGRRKIVFKNSKNSKNTNTNTNTNNKKKNISNNIFSRIQSISKKKAVSGGAVGKLETSNYKCFLNFLIETFFLEEKIFDHRVTICKALNNFILFSDTNRRELRKFIFMNCSIQHFQIILKCSHNSRELQKMILEVFVEKLKRWKTNEFSEINFPKSLIKSLVSIWKRTYDSDLKLLSAECLATFSNQGKFRSYLAENSNLSSIITHLKNKSVRNRIWAARVLSNLCSSTSSLHILNRLNSSELDELTSICFTQLSEFYSVKFDLEYLLYLSKICGFLMCVNKGDSDKLVNSKHLIREKFIHEFDSINSVFSIILFSFEASEDKLLSQKRKHMENSNSDNFVIGNFGEVGSSTFKKFEKKNHFSSSSLLKSKNRISSSLSFENNNNNINDNNSLNASYLSTQNFVAEVPNFENFEMSPHLEKIMILLFRIVKELLFFANRKGTGNYVIQQICNSQRRIHELLVFIVYKKNQKVCSIVYEVFLEFLPHPIPLPNFWKFVIEFVLNHLKNPSTTFLMLQGLTNFLKNLVFQSNISFSKKIAERIESVVFDLYIKSRPISNIKYTCGKILIRLHANYENFFSNREDSELFTNDVKTFIREFHIKKKRADLGASRGKHKLKRVLFSSKLGGGLMNLSKEKTLDGSAGGGIISALVKGKLEDVKRHREENSKKEMEKFLKNTKNKSNSNVGGTSNFMKNRKSKKNVVIKESDLKLLNSWKQEYGFFNRENKNKDSNSNSNLKKKYLTTSSSSIGYESSKNKNKNRNNNPSHSSNNDGFVFSREKNEQISFFKKDQLIFNRKELNKKFLLTKKKYNFKEEQEKMKKIDNALLNSVEFSIKEKKMIRKKLKLNNSLPWEKKRFGGNYGIQRKKKKNRKLLKRPNTSYISGRSFNSEKKRNSLRNSSKDNSSSDDDDFNELNF